MNTENHMTVAEALRRIADALVDSGAESRTTPAPMLYLTVASKAGREMEELAEELGLPLERTVGVSVMDVIDGRVGPVRIHACSAHSAWREPVSA